MSYTCLTLPILLTHILFAPSTHYLHLGRRRDATCPIMPRAATGGELLTHGPASRYFNPGLPWQSPPESCILTIFPFLEPLFDEFLHDCDYKKADYNYQYPIDPHITVLRLKIVHLVYSLSISVWGILVALPQRVT